jgi:hypothetical protein
MFRDKDFKNIQKYDSGLVLLEIQTHSRLSATTSYKSLIQGEGKIMLYVN